MAGVANASRRGSPDALRIRGSRDGPASVARRFFEIEFSANKDLCRRLAIKKLPCVQFFRGSAGCIDTVMCGPSKFPDVRVKLESLLGEGRVPSDVPEFTDVSDHYKE